MVHIKRLVVFAFAVFCEGAFQLPTTGFSFKARVQSSFGSPFRDFKISYTNSDDTNILAISESDSKADNLRVYYFAKKQFVEVKGMECAIKDINIEEFDNDILFPIKLDSQGLFTNPNSLLYLNGPTEGVFYHEIQAVAGADFANQTITIPGDPPVTYPCLASATWSAPNAELDATGEPFSVAVVWSTHAMEYSIYSYRTEVDSSDFAVPDGYYCETPFIIGDAVLPNVELKTANTLSFTKRGIDGTMKGWIDSNLGVQKIETIDDSKTTVIDMNNNIIYRLDKVSGSCEISNNFEPAMTPATFLYGVELPSTFQVSKTGVQVGTVTATVYSAYLDKVAHLVASIYFVDNVKPLTPIKYITRSKDGSFDESFIEGYTESISWSSFDIAPCLSQNAALVSQIFLSFDNHTEYGSSIQLEQELLRNLKEITGVKEVLRFFNIQPYKDGSVSFEILPRSELSNRDEPSSYVVVNKIVEAVNAGKFLLTKPDGSSSSATVSIYENLGAPQATYTGGSVFTISFLCSLASIVLGLALTVVLVKKVSSDNVIRRQLRI